MESASPPFTRLIGLFNLQVANRPVQTTPDYLFHAKFYYALMLFDLAILAKSIKVLDVGLKSIDFALHEPWLIPKFRQNFIDIWPSDAMRMILVCLAILVVALLVVCRPTVELNPPSLLFKFNVLGVNLATLWVLI